MTDRELLEKIAAQMQEGFKDVRNEIKDVNGRIEGLQDEMMEGFREAYNERREIKIKIEHDVTKNINLLVEGQKSLNNKIDEVLKFKDEKEVLTIRIEILENEITRIKARLDEIA